MSGLGDGIGTVIEGGLLGRAVEPAHGAGTETAVGPPECANCSALFTGHYCPNCGQKAHLHRSLAAIGHDIMHGVLHLDGKLLETLPLLAFRPGKLTRRYIEGERAKFVSPMAMFLFTVFAMFAVFQMVGISSPTDFGKGFVDGASDSSVFQTNIQQQITALEKERDGLSKADSRRAEIANEVKSLNLVLSKTESESEKSEGAVKVGGAINIEDGDHWIDKNILAKWKKNPSLMLSKLQANGYKFSWLLIPLSISFVWLTFAWRRQFKAYNHAVFVTYSLSFMSLLFITMSILSTIPGGGDWAVLLFLIAAPPPLYKQFRHAYGLTRFSAFWRFCTLLFSMQLVLIAFLLLLALLGAF